MKHRQMVCARVAPFVAALLASLCVSRGAVAQTPAWGAPPPQKTAAPLSPPPPAAGKSPTATQQQLEQSEREDAGRGLEWFWIQAEGGGAFAGASSLSNDRLLLPGTKASGGAGSAGLAAGGRLLFFTFGVRARLTFVSDYRIVSVLPEVGAHVPLGVWEPYVFLGAGYAALSGLPKNAGRSVSVGGFDGRVGLGVDRYLSPTFSVGALATSDFLFLGREKLAATATAPAEPKGSGTGVAITGSVVLGLHF